MTAAVYENLSAGIADTQTLGYIKARLDKIRKDIGLPTDTKLTKSYTKMSASDFEKIGNNCTEKDLHVDDIMTALNKK